MIFPHLVDIVLVLVEVFGAAEDNGRSFVILGNILHTIEELFLILDRFVQRAFLVDLTKLLSTLFEQILRIFVSFLDD